ncbi:acyl-CoA carboxylase subunit beta [Saccharomonospora azurea]|uniref:acyl-CoA carboxylase subunit beta n=1 Tax=Saccharomonospora azurea TaxID=40988 RepID=UPI003D949BD1
MSGDESSEHPDHPEHRSTTADRLADLSLRETEIEAAEKRARDRQHRKGKLTARERIDLLVDPGSFVEIDAFVRHRCHDFGMEANRPYGDGVVTGFATIDGRRVCLFSHDFTVLGGSLGVAHGEKVIKALDMAMQVGCPMISINDSAGARIQEGVASLAYYAEVGRRVVKASGVIPQISLNAGPCAGGAAYIPALGDFTAMADEISYMFVTGPDVVETVTGERPTFDELGGPKVSMEVSGNVHYIGADEQDSIEWVKSLLSYLPDNNLSHPPVYDSDFSTEITESDLELDTLIPDSLNTSYDVHNVITRLVDDGEFLETQAGFAPNLVTGMARIEGHTVGVVANNPMYYAGALEIDSSEKAARFVRFCDAFNIPLLTLVDVPGYLPGVDQERRGILRRGIKLLYAYAESTVPKVTVVLRKAYGGGYAVMGSKHLGADVNFSWPTGEVAVMGAAGAVAVMNSRKLAALDEAERAQETERLTAEYEANFSNPYFAAERGYIDAVIRPSQTRTKVAKALAMLRDKRESSPAKKHSTMPL